MAAAVLGAAAPSTSRSVPASPRSRRGWQNQRKAFPSLPFPPTPRPALLGKEGEGWQARHHGDGPGTGGMHCMPGFWGVRVPWAPRAAKGHAGGSLVVSAQGRAGSSLCQPWVRRQGTGCKAAGCTGGSLLTVPSRAHGGCCPQLCCSRARGHWQACCKLTPCLLSLRGADGSWAPWWGLCPPCEGQGCPQSRRADPQLCSEDGGAGGPVPLRSGDALSTSGCGRGMVLGPSCSADTTVRAPNQLQRALPMATHPRHRPHPCPRAVPAPRASSIREWSHLMISLAETRAAK